MRRNIRCFFSAYYPTFCFLQLLYAIDHWSHLSLLLLLVYIINADVQLVLAQLHDTEPRQLLWVRRVIINAVPALSSICRMLWVKSAGHIHDTAGGEATR